MRFILIFAGLGCALLAPLAVCDDRAVTADKGQYTATYLKVLQNTKIGREASLLLRNTVYECDQRTVATARARADHWDVLSQVDAGMVLRAMDDPLTPSSRNDYVVFLFRKGAQVFKLRIPCSESELREVIRVQQTVGESHWSSIKYPPTVTYKTMPKDPYVPRGVRIPLRDAK